MEKKRKNLNTVIRHVFKDIEQISRYEVPKLLRVYVDIMNFFFIEIGREDLINFESDDISLYLELGIYTKTQLSLRNLNLSRPTISRLAKLDESEHSLTLPTDLNEEEAYRWLEDNLSTVVQERILSKIQVAELKSTLESLKSLAKKL